MKFGSLQPASALRSLCEQHLVRHVYEDLHFDKDELTEVEFVQGLLAGVLWP